MSTEIRKDPAEPPVSFAFRAGDIHLDLFSCTVKPPFQRLSRQDRACRREEDEPAFDQDWCTVSNARPGRPAPGPALAQAGGVLMDRNAYEPSARTVKGEKL